MRTFIGLSFNGELKRKLFKVQNILKDNSIKGSWVADSNFHLTLKFLGETTENQVEEISKILKNISDSHLSISAGLDKLGYFNKKEEKYGVIWIGLKGQIIQLERIYDTIENEIQALGFEKDKRKFAPHITIGRRVIINKLFGEIKRLVQEELRYEFVLDSLVLLKSEEIMKKRVYTPIKSYKLRSNPKINHR